MASLYIIREQIRTVLAFHAESLFSSFVQKRYLPFVRETKRSRKADGRNLYRHVLPHLGAYRLNGITTEMLMNWTNTLKLTGLTYSSCFSMFWLLPYVPNCVFRTCAIPSQISLFPSASTSATCAASSAITSRKRWRWCETIPLRAK